MVNEIGRRNFNILDCFYFVVFSQFFLYGKKSVREIDTLPKEKWVYPGCHRMNEGVEIENNIIATVSKRQENVSQQLISP